MRQQRIHLLILWLTLLFDHAVTVVAFDVSHLAGIWKLATDQLPRPEPTILERALGEQRPASAAKSQTVWLKLNPDGSFRQCNEGYVEGIWISGRWALEKKTNRLKFALNRNYYGPCYDIALEGTIIRQDQDDSVVVTGNVYKGKVSVPRSDPNFFRRDLQNQKLLGPFRLERTIATTAESGSSLDGALLEDEGAFL